MFQHNGLKAFCFPFKLPEGWMFLKGEKSEMQTA